MADKDFILKIVTPNGTVGPVICDSVKLSVADGKKKQTGGSYGIRRGHAASVLALDEGRIEALNDGKTVLTLTTSRGFARVDKDMVTVTVSDITK